MSKIVTLSAQAEHGKDCFANELKLQLESKNKKVLIIHNADYLKYIAKQYLGWDGQKDDKGRTLLQQLGTEKIRYRYPDFHVEGVYRIIDLLQNDFDYFLIPDTRFPNEITYLKLKGLNVATLHIKRNNFENSLSPEQRNHPSETALNEFEFDCYMKIDNGIENIKRSVDAFIREVLI